MEQVKQLDEKLDVLGPDVLKPGQYLGGYEYALVALKHGAQVCREGWNGKKMFVFVQKGSCDFAGAGRRPDQVAGVASNLFEAGDIGTITRMPCFCMRAAGGEIVTGWLASQTDMLAEDWYVAL